MSNERASEPLRSAFTQHATTWGDYRYVYPVVSRRLRGLSIGVNLNLDRVCSFDCVYCQIDRTSQPAPSEVDLNQIAAELQAIIRESQALFERGMLSDVPASHRVLRAITFSGDGEPSASPAFAGAVDVALRVCEALPDPNVRVVVLTNGCHLHRPAVAAAVDRLRARGRGELWVKLDAGTAAQFERINRSACRFEDTLRNLLATAQRGPVIVQSMFVRYEGAAPTESEQAAYIDRLRHVREQGGDVQAVYLYTLARAAAHPGVEALSAAWLEALATRVRSLGLVAETFG